MYSTCQTLRMNGETRGPPKGKFSSALTGFSNPPPNPEKRSTQIIQASMSFRKIRLKRLIVNDLFNSRGKIQADNQGFFAVA